MRFTPLALAGAWLIEPTPIDDDRGSFARTFCSQEFAAHGLATHFPQHSVSVSTRCGTLRGMHFQRPPHEEVKVVRCIAGAVHDVIVDLRPNSPTCRRWLAFELSAANGRQLYVPEGFAHGHITLTDAASLCYLISTPYVAGAGAGVRYDDPALAIRWPLPPAVVSERDRTWPDVA